VSDPVNSKQTSSFTEAAGNNAAGALKVYRQFGGNRAAREKLLRMRINKMGEKANALLFVACCGVFLSLSTGKNSRKRRRI